MSIALVHNKIPVDFMNREDLLTASVFGAMSHVPPRYCLVPFLRNGRNTDGKLLGSNEDWERVWKASHAEYVFWPRMSNACEPDLAIFLYDSSNTDEQLLAVVLVEAKFRSGKSTCMSQSPHRKNEDQLVNEWFHLIEGGACQNQTIPQGIPGANGIQKALIYVTADAGQADRDIQDSHKKAQEQPKKADHVSDRFMDDWSLCWVQWAAAERAAAEGSELINVEMPDRSLAKPQLRALDDLRAILQRLSLGYFTGFDELFVLLNRLRKGQRSVHELLQQTNLFETAMPPLCVPDR